MNAQEVWARVAAHIAGPQPKPRRKVRVERMPTGVWRWTVGKATPGLMLMEAQGYAPSQPAALALGLAALDTTRSH